MRLWHYELIPYLPKSQLLAQWRELNSIYVNQPKHILINYIYNYDKRYLMYYSRIVIDEMVKRGYKISDKSKGNYERYFGFKFNEFTNSSEFDKFGEDSKLIYPEHNDGYLAICYYNLKEKYIRGQKDFNKECWDGISISYLCTLPHLDKALLI